MREFSFNFVWVVILIACCIYQLLLIYVFPQSDSNIRVGLYIGRNYLRVGAYSDAAIELVPDRHGDYASLALMYVNCDVKNNLLFGNEAELECIKYPRQCT